MCDKCAASCAHLFTKICPFHKVRQLRWGNGCGFPPRVDPESQHGASTSTGRHANVSAFVLGLVTAVKMRP